MKRLILLFTLITSMILNSCMTQQYKYIIEKSHAEVCHEMCFKKNKGDIIDIYGPYDRKIENGFNGEILIYNQGQVITIGSSQSTGYSSTISQGSSSTNSSSSTDSKSNWDILGNYNSKSTSQGGSNSNAKYASITKNKITTKSNKISKDIDKEMAFYLDSSGYCYRLRTENWDFTVKKKILVNNETDIAIEEKSFDLLIDNLKKVIKKKIKIISYNGFTTIGLLTGIDNNHIIIEIERKNKKSLKYIEITSIMSFEAIE